MESWVSLGGKEGHTKFQTLAEPRIELGTLRLEGRDLTNWANNACPSRFIIYDNDKINYDEKEEDSSDD